MKRAIEVCRSPLRAAVNVPGSKSITNRALICAALARGESVLRNASDSDDTALMCNGLNQLGVLVRRQGDALVVSGAGGRLYAPKFPIPAGNAGTTLRFMLSLSTLASGTTIFEADARMAERPMDDLLEALRAVGVQATMALPGQYIVHGAATGGTLRGGRVLLRASKSSQFLSSLLMVAPYAKEDVMIEVHDTLVSSSYVELTLEVMRHFGGAVEQSDARVFRVRSGQRYHAAEYEIEPDASSAMYFFAAAALCGGEVMVERLRLSSLQPDIRFLHVLQAMGCSTTEERKGVKVERTGELRGVEVDMNAMPDAVPTLAALAPFAATPTRITNVAHLRHKESDRLSALAAELRKLGADVHVTDDKLTIHPSPLRGCLLETYNDHRLAMSFALIGLRTPGVEIGDPGCVRKSFPGFWGEFDKLYDFISQ